MLVIDVEAGAVLARLTGMLDQIRHVKRVDVGAELSTWQTDDMHRHRPFTMRSRGRGTATTKVRPHSLYEMRQSEMASRRFLRATARYQKFIASGRRRPKRKPRYISIAESGYRKWSTRPILREVLLARLRERMDALLAHKLRWELSHRRAVAAHAADEIHHAAKVFAVQIFGARGAAAVEVVDRLRALERRTYGGES